MTEFLNNALFIFQRLNWLGIIDILLVTLIFFGVLYLVRDTQAMILLRGIILILVLFALITSLVNLPALLLAYSNCVACHGVCHTGHFCARNSSCA